MVDLFSFFCSGLSFRFVSHVLGLFVLCCFLRLFDDKYDDDDDDDDDDDGDDGGDDGDEEEDDDDDWGTR